MRGLSVVGRGVIRLRRAFAAVLLAVSVLVLASLLLGSAPRLTVSGQSAERSIVASPLKPENAWIFPGFTGARPSPSLEAVIPLGRRGVAVPILEYHYVRINPNRYDRLGYNLSVTPADFVLQMNWLANHGYHPIWFDDLRAYFSGLQPLPAKPVVLTFDDGYLDFFTTAFPILQSLNFKSVAYIVPGFFGRKAYMTPDEIMLLDQSGLVEIASHTVNHVDLARSSPGYVAYQLRASKAMLAALVDHPVVDFCYPSGQFNAAVVAAVDAAGYSTATTELPGTELSWSTRLRWPRVRVAGGESLAMFIANLGRPEATVQVQAA